MPLQAVFSISSRLFVFDSPLRLQAVIHVTVGA